LDAERGDCSRSDANHPSCWSRSPEASAMRWLLDQLVKEVGTDRPGAMLASKQLAQLLCVQILRSYLETSALVTAGWLRALNERPYCTCVAPHTPERERAWQVENWRRKLACHDKLRSALQVRVGVAPLTYLLNLLDAVCRAALREGSMSVSELGLSLGYATESAFSNAYPTNNGNGAMRYRNVFASMGPIT
jgi:AraC-like DNA-binding protein